jgi:hypothetical protein
MAGLMICQGKVGPGKALEHGLRGEGHADHARPGVGGQGGRHVRAGHPGALVNRIDRFDQPGGGVRVVGMQNLDAPAVPGTWNFFICPTSGYDNRDGPGRQVVYTIRNTGIAPYRIVGRYNSNSSPRAAAGE